MKTWFNLEIISIELTHACNLDCVWCFNKYSYWFSRKNFLHYETLIRKLLIFEKWRQRNNIKKPLIKLTWWEPLLYYKFKELVIFIKKYLWYKIKLNTNGLLLNRFSKAFIEKNIDIILFSYHFLDESTYYNKWYSYKKNLASLIISSYSEKIFKIICTRINKKFIYNFDKYITFVSKKFKFNKYIFWFPLLAQWEKLDFTKEDFKIFADKVNFYSKKLQLDLKIWFPPAFCFDNKPEELNSVTEIENLYTFMWIRLNFSPIWKITTSYYYSEDNFDLNSEKDLDNFFSSKFLQAIQNFDWLDKRCLKCKFFQKCWWWNRMFAFANNWNFYSQDPWISNTYLQKLWAGDEK